MLKSSLYYPDAGKETAEIINSSGEPWRPLSKLFLPTENKYIKERTPGEMYELRDRMEKYKLEYAESVKSPSLFVVKSLTMQCRVELHDFASRL